MPKLFFTIGPPRSGKSTYCTNWANESPNRVIVCGDSIRESLGFEFCKQNETLVQGTKDLMIRALLNRGQDVIVDGTHSTIPSIKRMFIIDKQAMPIWIPNFEYYDLTGGDSFEEVQRIQNEKDSYLNQLIERGIATKGEYIVPVIHRIVSNIRDLVLHTSFCGPTTQTIDNRKNLNFLREYEKC